MTRSLLTSITLFIPSRRIRVGRRTIIEGLFMWQLDAHRAKHRYDWCDHRLGGYCWCLDGTRRYKLRDPCGPKSIHWPTPSLGAFWDTNPRKRTFHLHWQSLLQGPLLSTLRNSLKTLARMSDCLVGLRYTNDSQRRRVCNGWMTFPVSGKIPSLRNFPLPPHRFVDMQCGFWRKYGVLHSLYSSRNRSKVDDSPAHLVRTNLTTRTTYFS